MYWIKPPDERTRWHVWFAWFPVVVCEYKDGGEKVVWFQNVLRCGKYLFDMSGGGWIWHYKEITGKEE